MGAEVGPRRDLESEGGSLRIADWREPEVEIPVRPLHSPIRNRQSAIPRRPWQTNKDGPSVRVPTLGKGTDGEIRRPNSEARKKSEYFPAAQPWRRCQKFPTKTECTASATRK
jgi:hypothetical protein